MLQTARIFVSHAHEDNDWCRGFVNALRDKGADVWYDEHNLGHGRLMEKIELELSARPVFVVILSPAAVASPWVKREVGAAMFLQDDDPARVLIPVVAQKCDIPLFWNSYRRASGPDDMGLTPDGAARKIDDLINSPTGTAPDAYERANTLRKEGHYAEALPWYDAAIALDATHAKAWNNKGIALQKLQRYEEALRAHERALELHPDYENARKQRAIVLRQLGRAADAGKP